jgi:hypothetical protein
MTVAQGCRCSFIPISKKDLSGAEVIAYYDYIRWDQKRLVVLQVN